MLRTITLQCRLLRTKQLVPSIAMAPAYRLRHPLTTRIPTLSRTSYVRYLTSTHTATTPTTTVTATHCPGCGAPFQQTQPDQPGYLITPTNATSDTTKKKKKPSSGLDHTSYMKLVEQLDPETRALLEGNSNNDPTTTTTSNLSSSTTTSTMENVDTTPPSPATTTPICQRCHQLTHYTRTNEPEDAHFLRTSQQYSSLVSLLRTKRQPLLVYVMDVTDMPWSIQALQPLLQGGGGTSASSPRVVVVANKIDLLPPRAIQHHEQRIRDAITMNIKRTIGTSPLALQLVSAKKGWGISTLIKRLQSHLLPTDDLYVVGSVNAGKSALIQQCLNQQSRSTQKHQYRPTSSSVPGTTLGLVRIPLHILGLQQQPSSSSTPAAGGRGGVTRDHYLIDTPGLISKITPISKKKKPSTIHPVTFRLHAHQSLLLDHHVRIDVLETHRPLLMTLFTPNAAPHITKTAKLLNNTTTTTNMVQHPNDVTVTSAPTRTSRGRQQAVMDLAFAGGIGWVALTGDFGQARLRVWLDPQTTDFTIRDPSFLPFEFRGQVRKFFGSGERAMQ